MKRLLVGLMAAAALVTFNTDVAKALTVTDYPAGVAANGIGNSRHNLGSFGKVLRTNGTSEICVFCHTPHHTNTAVSPAPLWNRVNNASYTAYGATLGGSNVSAVGSVSLACLSCHDGVTTFDSLVNAPGAGGVNSSGSNPNWVFYMPIATSPAGNINWDHFQTGTWPGFPSLPANYCSNCHTSNNPAERLSIGTTVANDHPVSVTYNASVAGLRPTNTIINSINLTAGLASSATTVFSGNLNQNRWAIKGFISDTATIADLLKNGKVECSSCHDPHFKNSSWDEAEPTWQYYWDPYINGYSAYSWCAADPEKCGDGNFLRRVGGNTGSGVCRTCHDK